VVTALAERGISVTGIIPRPITSELVAAADLVVTMGRYATGPILPGTAAHHHWQLDFPGDDLGAMRTLCDQVDGRVQALLAELG
jgi:protein-tyrosine-phosphatase